MDFRIDVENGKAKLTTPYNPEFVKKIKNAGGKWNRTEKVWVVDEDNIEYAREIMNDVYGRSDLPASDLVDVKITFEYEKGEFCAPYVIMGKVVSRACGRDSGAKPGDDVVFTKGKPISAGSVKNWQSAVTEDSVAILKNVPKSKAENFEEEGITVEVLDSKKENKEKLMKEKEALEARLKEIEKLLAK